MRVLVLLGLILSTWVVTLYHRIVFVRPETISQSQIESAITKAKAEGSFLARSRTGLNHIVLQGSSLERGVTLGFHTQHLLRLQEEALNKSLEEIFPSKVFQQSLLILAMRLFWGIDPYFEKWMLEEIYGVSLFAPDTLKNWADPFTRQIGLHGLHEVGQLMVDSDLVDGGCTLFSIPQDRGFFIGRNFDFEAGRIFDEEKLIKWVFPLEGFAYVSVIWSGMVGGVSGINEHGVGIFINAAGSKDFRRYGTPSTLVLTQALMKARTAEEAASLIESATVFISDIYTVVDRSGSPPIRIDKTPLRHERQRLEGPQVVSNHFETPGLREDPFNQERMKTLSTVARKERGKLLLATLPKTSAISVETILMLLRDKSDLNGNTLPLGHRQAIDPLVASHSIVFDTRKNVLFVSEGPGLAGSYQGFDLEKSFKTRQPVRAGETSRDDAVSPKRFYETRLALKEVQVAKKWIAEGDCQKGGALLQKTQPSVGNHYQWVAAQGDFFYCEKNWAEAKRLWSKALNQGPAYYREREKLEQKILEVNP